MTEGFIRTMGPLMAKEGDARAVSRVGYVLSLFPCYDETFILREMKALKEHGVSLSIFSLRKRRNPVVQEDARPFIRDTRYAAFVFSREVLGATVRTLWNKPRAVAELLALVVKGCWPYPARLSKTLLLFPKMFLFAEAASREAVQHLHAHWATYPATAAMVMSKLTGIPWSFTCHAHDIFLNPTLLPEKLEAAAFALTCTADNKRHLETLSPLARDRVRVAYHGLDLKLFRPGPPRPPSETLRILAVGSLLPCKGFEYLVEACRRLKERGLKFDLTIAGGGPEDASLRQAACKAGLEDRIRFVGYVTQGDLIPLYREAEIFTLPAVLEIHWGIPNVLVEALACGLPVVTTALPSLPELVEDGVHGLVAANRNPRDLADKIEVLASDPARRRSMGRAGRRRVETRFDIDRTIESVVEPLVRGVRGLRHAS